ncbi:hypothetical protein U1Q18_024012 [Sarracenia purpurea var. burkii]
MKLGVPRVANDKTKMGYNSFLRRSNLITILSVAVLCTLSYSLTLWQNGGAAITSIATTSNLAATITCIRFKNTTSVSKLLPRDSSTAAAGADLDFASHSSTDGGGGATLLDPGVKTYFLCNVKYNEYSPCEDAKRYLKFDRNRLIYREGTVEVPCVGTARVQKSVQVAGEQGSGLVRQ